MRCQMEYGYRGEIHVFEFMLQWDKLFQAHHPDPIIYMYRLICELPKFVKLKAGRVQIPLWPVPLVYSRVPKRIIVCIVPVDGLPKHLNVLVFRGSTPRAC
jgi:hypothetical protein